MIRTQRWWVWGACWLAACSQDVATGKRCTTSQHGCSVRARAEGGGAGSSASDAGSTGAAGTAGSGPIGSRDNALMLHVEDIAGMTIEIVTLRCTGDCADVEAVARGGNPPYSFAWEDGSTAPARRVCLEASRQLTIRATDTAIETVEFEYEARTVTAVVTATVLDCTDGGVLGHDAGAPTSTCGPGATPVFRVMSKQDSKLTSEYALANGELPDYAASSLGGVALAIVGTARHSIELGSCTQLRLAGDAAGTKTVGWDDSLIVEYRSAPGAEVEKRWYYGSAGSLVYTPTNETLESTLAPSVPGFDVDPPIPNPFPFGYPPLAIDLMEQVPAGATRFELSIHVLDAGTVGSTSEIWAIPR